MPSDKPSANLNSPAHTTSPLDCARFTSAKRSASFVRTTTVCSPSSRICFGLRLGAAARSISTTTTWTSSSDMPGDSAIGGEQLRTVPV